MAIALVAIVAILLANMPFSSYTVPSANKFEPACRDCGTVLTVRKASRATHPLFYVTVRMPNGERRTVAQLAAGFDAGDQVRVNGDALSLIE